MPIDVRFDEDSRLIHVVITGTWPTLAELVAVRSQLTARGAIRDDVVELVDVCEVTRGLPNISQMEGILLAIGKPPHRRAIVVRSNVQYSAGKMAELLDPKGIKVFRDEASARKWLLDPGPEEPPTVDRSRSGRISVFRNKS